MYKYFNNVIVNSYFEAELPPTFRKPSQSSSNEETRQFIVDKYVNRRWVSSKMKMTPVELFHEDRKKFNKYVEKVAAMYSGQPIEDEDEKKKAKKEKKEKKRKRSDAGGKAEKV